MLKQWLAIQLVVENHDYQLEINQSLMQMMSLSLRQSEQNLYIGCAQFGCMRARLGVMILGKSGLGQSFWNWFCFLRVF
jgi:hypothetical protein